MTCPFCRSSLLMEIELHVGDAAVTMHSCPACERRWWEKEGAEVPLRSVLDLVAAG